MGVVVNYIGKLYQISEDRGWNHVIFDMNPNNQLTLPVNIIQPGDIFLVLDVDYSDFWFQFEDEDLGNQICLKILYEDTVGWIMVQPDDIKDMSNTP